MKYTELNHIASKGIRSEIDGNVVVIGSGLMEESGIEIEADQSHLIRQKETHYNLLYLIIARNWLPCSAWRFQFAMRRKVFYTL